MTRDHRPKPSGPVYAPLLGRMVECATLHVARFGGRKFRPARDEGGRVIEVPVAAELGELKRRVAAPGRYRISARDPTSGNIMAHSDYMLGSEPEASVPSPVVRMRKPAVVASVGGSARRHEPAAVPKPALVLRVPMYRFDSRSESDPRVPKAPVYRTASMTELPDALEPWPFLRAPEPLVVPDHVPPIAPGPEYVAMLHETVEQLRDRLRECRMRADDEIRAESARADRVVAKERERGEAALRASEEAREAWRAKAFEAEVRLAGASAWLEEREARVAELERRVAELKAEVASARREAAGLRQRAEGPAFSPLDALGQMDQALDVIGKAAERFGKRA